MESFFLLFLFVLFLCQDTENFEPLHYKTQKPPANREKDTRG